MRHIDEIQIAGTAILLCGAMFAVSAVAPTGNTVSKAVTNFTEAPETAAGKLRPEGIIPYSYPESSSDHEDPALPRR